LIHFYKRAGSKVNMDCRSSVSLVLVCMIQISKQSQTGSLQWNYHSMNGWMGECSTGTRQSPIDIRDVVETSFPPWKFSGYSEARHGQVINNGHSLKFSLNGGSQIQMSGGGLPAPYIFWTGHFHWGNSSYRGSEHKLGGQAFPLELHLVHYNSQYGSIENSLPHGDGLAVLSVLFSLSPNGNPSLSPLLSALSPVSQPGTQSPISGALVLSSLLPTDPSTFYRYPGSLTTPGCNEVVTWTIFHQSSSVSEDQLQALRGLIDSSGERMGDNYRAVQPVHARQVLGSSQETGQNIVCNTQHTIRSDQWQTAMVPGWAVLLLCLAVGLNVGGVVMLVRRKNSSHIRVATLEPRD